MKMTLRVTKISIREFRGTGQGDKSTARPKK